jgi:hypothetical protein
MSFKAEILPRAHDEKNARRGYQLPRPKAGMIEVESGGTSSQLGREETWH